MRVSTGMIFQRGLDSMLKQQSQLLDTQQHISAGRKLLSPSDDPVAAARIVETEQAQALNAQYGANQAAARDALALSEATLGDVGDVLQDVRQMVINANNGAMTEADRRTIAADLRAKLSQLVGLANTRDGAGAFLFAGFQQNVQPYSQTATGATFNGDQGHRELQVSPTRTLPVNQSGAEIFERVREGNGTFATASDAGNDGTGLITLGRTTGAVTVPVEQYELVFTVAAGVTTYDVVNVTTATTVSTGNAYTSGAAIQFANMEVAISGDPANGDSFDITPAQNQNIFTTLVDIAAVLETGVGGAADRTRLAEGLDRALANIDQTFEKTLSTRADMGASLRELDALSETVLDNELHYATRLSGMRDLDYAAALTQFTREQTALEAAQLSFQRVTSLSLFDYL